MSEASHTVEYGVRWDDGDIDEMDSWEAAMFAINDANRRVLNQEDDWEAYVGVTLVSRQVSLTKTDWLPDVEARRP